MECGVEQGLWWLLPMAQAAQNLMFTKTIQVPATVQRWVWFFLNCKAFNGRLVCEWLLSKLLEIKAAPPAGVILDDRFDLCEAALTLVDTYTNFCHHPQYVLLFWSDYMVSLSEKECPPKEYRLKNRSPIRPIMCFPHWWAGLRNRIHPNHLCPSGWWGGTGEEGLRRLYEISQSVFPVVPQALLLDSANSQSVL